MKTLGKIQNTIERYGMSIFLMTMFILISCQVFFRYVLRVPLPWAEELARYCMIWATYLGVSLCIKDKAHVGVDGLVTILPESIRRIIDVFIIVVVATLNVVLFVLALQLTLTIAGNGQKSPALVMPMWIAYAALPVSFGFGSIHSLTSFVKDIKKALNKDGEGRGVS